MLACSAFIFLGNLLSIPYQLTKVQVSSSNNFGDILLLRLFLGCFFF